MELPYIGYFEADIAISGITVCNRAVLVVRDCSTSRRVPGLIGTNVLSQVPQVASWLNDLGSQGKATSETFGFARIAGSQPVCVPARSTCYVLAVGGRDCSTTVLEPLQADCGNPLILAAVVNA